MSARRIVREPYVIMRAEANVIERIGNRPALERLGEAIRALPSAGGPYPARRRVREKLLPKRPPVGPG